jgi:transposase
MSLRPTVIGPVPAPTAQVAHAAFPRGNVYLTLREKLGTVFRDEDFADLYPEPGRPGLSPWRLALVTVLQFRENLSDRQAAEAVRARIDWKYLLGLELTDPGFDYSVLSEFRARLSQQQASERMLEKLLAQCQAQGLLRAGGRQRTDATHVLAAVRVLNRLELVAETLRMALNAVAAVAPEWLQRHVPESWYQRYGRRIEYSRRPSSERERQRTGQAIGADGLRFLAWLDEPDAPTALRELTEVRTLDRVWQRHYRREAAGDDEEEVLGRVRLATKEELATNPEPMETPYDIEARYRNKRGHDWVGYTVHLSETCDEERVNLITQVTTTPANVAEAKCTAVIQQALVDRGRAPKTHLADGGYIAADLLVESATQRGITLVGPIRDSARWQQKVEGAYAVDQFRIDWDAQQAHCPQGHTSVGWWPYTHANGHAYIRVSFAKETCAVCPQRARCTRAKDQPRSLQIQPQPQQEAITHMRAYLESPEGRKLYAKRAGIEGTLSQGVRAFGLRRSRYVGLGKTHLQQVAIAAAMNLDRLAAWFVGRPRAHTRVSRFAALAA